MLASCSIVPTKFDNVEYDNIVKLSYLSERGDIICTEADKSAHLAEFQRQSALTLKYIVNTRETTDLKTSIQVVDKQINELVTAYTQPRIPSVSYCEIKFAIINISVNSIMTTIGSKQR